MSQYAAIAKIGNESVKTINKTMDSWNEKIRACEALVYNADSKGHTFYSYNNHDSVYWISYNKPYIGSKCTGHVTAASQIIKVYVDDKSPQYIARGGNKYVYLDGNFMSHEDFKRAYKF